MAIVLVLGYVGSAAANWTVSGDDMYSSVAGNIGIGTTQPTCKLQIDHNNYFLRFFKPNGAEDKRMYGWGSVDILCGFRSNPITSCPFISMHVATGSPNFPSPTNPIFMLPTPFG